MVTLHDIMTVDVLTVSPDLSLRELAELLAEHHISGVPVVANRRVVGVISAMDLLEFDANSRGVPAERPDESWTAAEAPEWEEGEESPAAYFSAMWENAGADVQTRLRLTDSPEWDVLEEHTTSEIMTRTLCCLPPETPVREAAEYMLRSDVHRILVTEDDHLVGVVTTTDIVKAVSQHGLGG